MTESRSHKQGKGSAARKEVPISRNRRLDAIRGHHLLTAWCSFNAILILI